VNVNSTVFVDGEKIPAVDGVFDDGKMNLADGRPSDNGFEMDFLAEMDVADGVAHADVSVRDV
jgi:hypothetical protein